MIPTLTDGVVLLGPYALDDVAAHVAGEDEEHARRFGWWPRHSTDETVRRFVEQRLADWQAGAPRRAFAVREAESRELVGGVEVRVPAPGLAELSYWTFPPYRRRGFASRALELACRYAARELAVERAELLVEPDNAASRGVARRSGFSVVGMEVDDQLRVVLRYRRSLQGLTP